jgi:plasmid stabilization system protein ParE
MVKVEWSQTAVNDLQQIVEYIAHDKPATAELYRQKILSATRRLENFPRSGRIVPEKNDDTIREIIYGNYRIIYGLTETSVRIFTVHHASRLLNL